MSKAKLIPLVLDRNTWHLGVLFQSQILRSTLLLLSPLTIIDIGFRNHIESFRACDLDPIDALRAMSEEAGFACPLAIARNTNVQHSPDPIRCDVGCQPNRKPCNAYLC